MIAVIILLLCTTEDRASVNLVGSLMICKVFEIYTVECLKMFLTKLRIFEKFDWMSVELK